MEKILLVIHGSPRSEANRWDPFIQLLARTLNRQEQDLHLSYLQFGVPSFDEALKNLILQGSKRIIIHPFFLSAGQHVTKDIPEVIERYKRDFPEVEIYYTKPLGFHEKLAEIVKERILETGALKPKEIEERSFELIEREVDLSNFSYEERVIVKRVIHATADLEYKDTFLFHRDAISKAIELLREGKDILVDVEMVRAGITKRYKKNRVLCYLSEIEEEGEGTRTERAVELALAKEKNLGLIAIGNAPTALLKVIEILNKEKRKDLVVIGLPVGFVKALEAKMLLASQEFPFITNLSRKGGSPACVAVVNALLHLAHTELEGGKKCSRSSILSE